jgi:hypothetical protein
MSLLLRHVATPAKLGGGSPEAREKIYSLFLNGLAETMPGNHNDGQIIACQPHMGYRPGAFAGKKDQSKSKLKGTIS